MAESNASLELDRNSLIPQLSPEAQTSKKTCSACKRNMSVGVEYKSRLWHKDCFTCINCHEILAGKKFLSDSHNPYCFKCYGELFAHKCDRCKLPIHGFGDVFVVTFAERHWHIECFFCNNCEKSLLGQLIINRYPLIFCTNCA